MDRQTRIRRELEDAEKKCNIYGPMTANQPHITEWRETYVHYWQRRKYFLKDLLKVQLKEFNRD